jgi:hypothetical protein
MLSISGNVANFLWRKLKAKKFELLWKKIYSINPDSTDDTEGCIERFLGPEILSEPDVQ